MPQKVLVVGAGLSGATVAQQHLERGDEVVVYDKRDHLAGNAFTDSIDGQLIHVYGPHVFHTRNEETWAYVNRFCKMQRYTHQVKAIGSDGKLYPLPFSLATFHGLFGTRTPAETRTILTEETNAYRGETETVEGWCLKHVGKTLYETLIRDYTQKMWGRPPETLPASLIKRLPLRLDSFNTDYFDDPFQGVPEAGYTSMVSGMLKGAKIILGTFCGPAMFNDYHRVYYTGLLDELNGHELGRLETRGLRFDRFVGASQGCAQLNDCGTAKHTRTTESWLLGTHKKPNRVWLVRETPDDQGEPAYPINNDRNAVVQYRYVQMTQAKWPHLVPVGRMATWRYLDMDQAIGQALKACE